MEEDRAAGVSLPREDHLLRTLARDGSVDPPSVPHAHSTASPNADRPDGSSSGASLCSARLRKRAVVKVPVSRTGRGGWLSWTLKKKAKVGTKKTRGVHLGSEEASAEAHRGEGSGDLKSCGGGEPPRPGEKGETQQEDGDDVLGLGEQPLPDEKGETQQEERNGDSGLGKCGELPVADEEEKTQKEDGNDDFGLGEGGEQPRLEQVGGNGDSGLGKRGELPVADEEDKTQKEDGNDDLGFGEGGEQPRLEEKGETQQVEGNDDFVSGEGGELPKADKEKGKQLSDMYRAVGELIAILAADRQQKTPASFLKETLVEKTNESSSCSTEVPCGGFRPPRNVVEALNLLAGEPNRRFEGMNVLDILKMKGIDLTPPPRKRHQGGPR